MITVLLVDDHDIVRLGVKKLLEEVKDINVLGEAKSGEDALLFVQKQKPNVVLMDMSMPGIGGIEATRKLIRIAPGVKVLGLSGFDDDLFPSRLIQAGGCGYITKGASLNEMVKAIRTVYRGERYFSHEVAQKLAIRRLDIADKSPFEALSERELQVAMMVVAGLKAPVISQKLCIDGKTVNGYRYRVFKKLGIKGDVELTRLAISYGLVETDQSSS